MHIGFLVAGVVLAVVTFGLRERRRRVRIRTRVQFERDGMRATAHVTGVWHEGRKGRRELSLRYADHKGRTHETSAALEAAEAGVLSIFPGARLEICYFPTKPGDVVVVRPEILDDRFSVSLIAGGAVFTVCMAIGALVTRTPI